MIFAAPFLAGALTILAAQNIAPVNAPPPPSQHPPALASVDREFAVAAAAGNEAELDAARLAIARSTTDEVKAYAQKMLAEHGDIGMEAAPATKPFLSGTPALSEPDALAMQYLGSLGPVDFDQQYLLLQVGDHLAALTAFQTESRDGKDPALKAFATKWTPTIESHLQLAIALAKHLSGDSPLK
jgi:putative membrane protein